MFRVSAAALLVLASRRVGGLRRQRVEGAAGEPGDADGRASKPSVLGGRRRQGESSVCGAYGGSCGWCSCGR